jgi:hypothetical protein
MPPRAPLELQDLPSRAPRRRLTRPRPHKASWAGALCLVAALLRSSAASATPQFPDAIRTHLGLSYAPECALCHAGGIIGSGTVTTPFGQSARSRNLVANDTGGLVSVLERMRGEKVDSDQDGVPDIDELIAGTDPNSAPGDDIGPEKYGCVARVAGGRGERGAALLSAAALAAALGRRLGRRRRASWPGRPT